MQLSGHRRIEAPRTTVWQALNDPDILKASIPGCESMERTSDNSFDAKVKAKVGPVSARFAGSILLSDIDPPKGCRISGEGKGGVAGFAKGGATVRLEEDEKSTILHYDVDATVGGKLAQIGSRVVDGAAKKMADDFFARFAAEIGAAAPAEASEAAAATPEPPPETPPEPEGVEKPLEPRGSGAWAKVGLLVAGLAAVAIVLVLVYL